MCNRKKVRQKGLSCRVIVGDGQLSVSALNDEEITMLG